MQIKLHMHIQIRKRKSKWKCKESFRNTRMSMRRKETFWGNFISTSFRFHPAKGHRHCHHHHRPWSWRLRCSGVESLTLKKIKNNKKKNLSGSGAESLTLKNKIIIKKNLSGISHLKKIIKKESLRFRCRISHLKKWKIIKKRISQVQV